MTGRVFDWLPATADELAARRWSEIDVLLVTGDAYFDHPSHGAAVIGRVLEAAGYRVALLARPDWRSPVDFRRFGRPRLFAGITAGAVDSLLNNWTADLRRRRDDAYAPDGQGGGRPDLATVVYANRVREAYPGLPLVLGGIEASLRRFAHFDPQTQTVRRSILIDARADVLVYGAGEQPVVEIAARLAAGLPLDGIAGTVRLVRGNPPPPAAGDLELPDYAALRADPRGLVAAALTLESSAAPGFTGRVRQRHAEGLVLAEPRPVMSTAALDAVHALPFSGRAHPSAGGRIAALEVVRHSVISHRGCPGGCSFCGLALHQGRAVVTRSPDSVLGEIRRLTARPDFRGTVSDVGGPTANAYGVQGRDAAACARCRRPSCLVPEPCARLQGDPRALLDLLDTARHLPRVRRVLLASGIRHDWALRAPDFIREVARHYTGGHLKVAPEHVAPAVLRLMRKPGIEVFEAFEAAFLAASRAAGREQYLVPYFIAAFPGCTPADADRAGRWLARRGQRLQQVQSFIPLPGTLAAAFQAAGCDAAGVPLYRADARERRRQKALLTGGPPPTGPRPPPAAPGSSSRRPSRRAPSR